MVFTSGPLRPVNRVFFERLAKDPLLHLLAIVVEENQRPRGHSASSFLSGFRDGGWRWPLFNLATELGSLVGRIGHLFLNLTHPATRPQDSYEDVQREIGIRVYRVSNIQSEQSVTLIQSLRPQLGVTVGGRLFSEPVISIPVYGTLRLQTSRTTQFDDDGSVGYWEMLAGEPSIGITIHYTLSQGHPGFVISETAIPIEECDTLESLQIKADISGAKLYHDTIRRIASGEWGGARPNIVSQITQQPPPNNLSLYLLRRRLRRQAEKRMPLFRTWPSWPVRIRLLLQYLLVLPWLLYARQRFAKQGKAPISILCYHAVGNRPINHLCLPLEKFVQHIEFIRRHYELISLDDAVSRVRSGRNEKLAVAITFDDGYRETHWAVQYLAYFGIPACFFVSAGHVQDESLFEHDLRAGFRNALPMSAAEVQILGANGMVVGSHGMYHEDFGKIETATADHVLHQSCNLIREITGREPVHFSFPVGQRKRNMTHETFALAQKYYPYVYSAYGGYNFPSQDRSHFLRLYGETDALGLVMVMNGYTGFRAVLNGDAWGLTTLSLSPY